MQERLYEASLLGDGDNSPFRLGMDPRPAGSAQRKSPEEGSHKGKGGKHRGKGSTAGKISLTRRLLMRPYRISCDIDYRSLDLEKCISR